MMAAALVIAICLGAAAAVVLWCASGPWVRAVGQGSPRPRPVQEASVGRVGAGLVALAVGGVWLALEWANPESVLPQRPLLEQLLPLAVALWLGGSLAVLPWQPDWVATELRRIAVAAPVSTGLVLLVSSQVEPAVVGAVLAAAGLAVLVSLACWLLARALDRAGRRHDGGPQRHPARQAQERPARLVG